MWLGIHMYWVLCQDRLVDFFGGGGIGGGGGGGWAVLGDGKGIRRECKELMASAKVRV